MATKFTPWVNVETALKVPSKTKPQYRTKTKNDPGRQTLCKNHMTLARRGTCLGVALPALLAWNATMKETMW